MEQKSSCVICSQESRIRQLETSQAESKVYVKQILENLGEVKADIKELKNQKGDVHIDDDNKQNIWQPIVTELIRLLGTVITILGTLAGAQKMLIR